MDKIIDSSPLLIFVLQFFNRLMVQNKRGLNPQKCGKNAHPVTQLFIAIITNPL